MNYNEEKRIYEISFLVNQAAGEAGLFSLLKQYGAEVSYKSPVSEIKLAYPIKKYQQAYFGFLHFSAKPEEVEKIMSSLKLNPVFLRVLIVTPLAGVRGRAEGRVEKTVRPKAEKSEFAAVPVQKGILSNEALEQKLEEILK